MKRVYFLAGVMLILSQQLTAQSVGISTNGATPFAGAMLDVQSTSKGFLMPRLTTAERTAMPSLAKGLMVFDSTNNQFWYYTDEWQQLSNNGWGLAGNGGIDAANNFIGTTDGTPLNFRTSDTNRLQITSGGDIVIPTDQTSLQFATTGTIPTRPMMRMFQSGTANRDRMVIAHSPAFPSWGLEYRDTTDVFFMRSSSGRKFAFELASGHMGIGVEDPEFPLDAVGRFRLRADGNLSNSPGIWFANQDNTFDRAFLGMSKPDSGFGIYSQNLNRWAIEFEVMREPRIGINTRNGGDGVVRAELHVMHTNFGGSNDGIRIQNEGSNNQYWNLYTSNTTGFFEFYKNGIKRATIDDVSGAYAAVSDERLKRNIQKMPDGVLAKMMLLQPSTYQFTRMVGDEGGRIESDRYYNGFLAQEVEKLFPALVYKGGDDPAKSVYTMDYAGFGVLAVKAIQEQQAIIEAQKTAISKLQVQMENILQKLAEKQQ